MEFKRTCSKRPFSIEGAITSVYMEKKKIVQPLMHEKAKKKASMEVIHTYQVTMNFEKLRNGIIGFISRSAVMPQNHKGISKSFIRYLFKP